MINKAVCLSSSESKAVRALLRSHDVSLHREIEVLNATRKSQIQTAWPFYHRVGVFVRNCVAGAVAGAPINGLD